MDGSLEGQLLIAMPAMGDPRFDRTVLFMCAHSEDGAMGLIVNKPAEQIPFASLLEQLDIEVGGNGRAARVHYGGPVEVGRGFVATDAFGWKWPDNSPAGMPPSCAADASWRNVSPPERHSATCRPPIGCIAVTEALCDQISAIGAASPPAMRFSAA